MNFFKNRIALKALSQSLIELSKHNPHFKEVADQIKQTRIALLVTSGVDPSKYYDMVHLDDLEAEIKYRVARISRLDNEIAVKTEMLNKPASIIEDTE